MLSSMSQLPPDTDELIKIGSTLLDLEWPSSCCPMGFF